jgi:two-component system, chemotaxis family, protein-glutamate methylesterase/glutaminase
MWLLVQGLIELLDHPGLFAIDLGCSDDNDCRVLLNQHRINWRPAMCKAAVRRKQRFMRNKGRNIIVIGTSSGGLDALDNLIGQLPSDLSASIFIVQHMAPENTADSLIHKLSRHRSFHCRLARNGESFKPQRIYIAPPDNHLLVKKNKLLVTKGARENRNRPGIDPLFRSAAVTHGPSVIGVVLTGMLDDGTAGLIAIKKCGGVTVVQDPKDAAYPGMPQSALNNLKVDYCVPIAEMGRLLETLCHEHPGKTKPIPKDISTEAEVAERVLSDVAQVNGLGSLVPYNCPNCGGVLWEIDSPDLKRYRCHTGHSFSVSALLTSQSEKIEETLWVALRMFEERKNLLNNIAHEQTKVKGKNSAAQRAKETQVHIERIKAMLLAQQSKTWEETFTRVKKVINLPRVAMSAREDRQAFLSKMKPNGNTVKAS